MEKAEVCEIDPVATAFVHLQIQGTGGSNVLLGDRSDLAH